MRYSTSNDAYTYLYRIEDKLSKRFCSFIKINCILVKCTCHKRAKVVECAVSNDPSTPLQFIVTKPECSRIKADIYLSVLHDVKED